MSVEFILTPREDGSLGAKPRVFLSAASPPPAAAADTSGLCHLGIQSMRKAWIYSKATGKTISWYHWMPAITLGTAVISAVTGTTVFANLSSNPATWAKAVVASVAVLVAVVTALQSWLTNRVKSLGGQATQFHGLYRKIETRLLDRSKPLTQQDVDGFEADLKTVSDAMITISNHAWNLARDEVDEEMKNEGLWDALRGRA